MTALSQKREAKKAQRFRNFYESAIACYQTHCSVSVGIINRHTDTKTRLLHTSNRDKFLMTSMYSCARCPSSLQARERFQQPSRQGSRRRGEHWDIKIYEIHGDFTWLGYVPAYNGQCVRCAILYVTLHQEERTNHSYRKDLRPRPTWCGNFATY